MLLLGLSGSVDRKRPRHLSGGVSGSPVSEAPYGRHTIIDWASVNPQRR